MREQAMSKFEERLNEWVKKNAQACALFAKHYNKIRAELTNEEYSENVKGIRREFCKKIKKIMKTEIDSTSTGGFFKNKTTQLLNVLNKEIEKETMILEAYKSLLQNFAWSGPSLEPESDSEAALESPTLPRT